MSQYSYIMQTQQQWHTILAVTTLLLCCLTTASCGYLLLRMGKLQLCQETMFYTGMLISLDLVHCGLLLCFTVPTQLRGVWGFGPEGCSAQAFVSRIVRAGSHTALICLALQQCNITIKRPKLRRLLQCRKTVFFFIWALAGSVSLRPWVDNDVSYRFYVRLSHCDVGGDYIVIHDVITFVIPCLFLTTFSACYVTSVCSPSSVSFVNSNSSCDGCRRSSDYDNDSERSGMLSPPKDNTSWGEGISASYDDRKRGCMLDVKTSMTVCLLCTVTSIMLPVETTFRLCGVKVPAPTLLACAVLFTCGGQVLRSATIIIIEKVYRDSGLHTSPYAYMSNDDKAPSLRYTRTNMSRSCTASDFNRNRARQPATSSTRASSRKVSRRSRASGSTFPRDSSMGSAYSRDLPRPRRPARRRPHDTTERHESIDSRAPYTCRDVSRQNPTRGSVVDVIVHGSDMSLTSQQRGHRRISASISSNFLLEAVYALYAAVRRRSESSYGSIPYSTPQVLVTAATEGSSAPRRPSWHESSDKDNLGDERQAHDDRTTTTIVPFSSSPTRRSRSVQAPNSLSSKMDSIYLGSDAREATASRDKRRSRSAQGRNSSSSKIEFYLGSDSTEEVASPEVPVAPRDGQSAHQCARSRQLIDEKQQPSRGRKSKAKHVESTYRARKQSPDDVRNQKRRNRHRSPERCSLEPSAHEQTKSNHRSTGSGGGGARGGGEGGGGEQEEEKRAAKLIPVSPPVSSSNSSSTKNAEAADSPRLKPRKNSDDHSNVSENYTNMQCDPDSSRTFWRFPRVCEPPGHQKSSPDESQNEESARSSPVEDSETILTGREACAEQSPKVSRHARTRVSDYHSMDSSMSQQSKDYVYADTKLQYSNHRAGRKQRQGRERHLERPVHGKRNPQQQLEDARIRRRFAKQAYRTGDSPTSLPRFKTTGFTDHRSGNEDRHVTRGRRTERTQFRRPERVNRVVNRYLNNLGIVEHSTAGFNEKRSRESVTLESAVSSRSPQRYRRSRSSISISQDSCLSESRGVNKRSSRLPSVDSAASSAFSTRGIYKRISNLTKWNSLSRGRSIRRRQHSPSRQATASSTRRASLAGSRWEYERAPRAYRPRKDSIFSPSNDDSSNSGRQRRSRRHRHHLDDHRHSYHFDDRNIVDHQHDGHHYGDLHLANFHRRQDLSKSNTTPSCNFNGSGQNMTRQTSTARQRRGSVKSGFWKMLMKAKGGFKDSKSKSGGKSKDRKKMAAASARSRSDECHKRRVSTRSSLMTVSTEDSLWDGSPDTLAREWLHPIG